MIDRQKDTKIQVSPLLERARWADQLTHELVERSKEQLRLSLELLKRVERPNEE